MAIGLSTLSLPSAEALARQIDSFKPVDLSSRAESLMREHLNADIPALLPQEEIPRQTELDTSPVDPVLDNELQKANVEHANQSAAILQEGSSSLSGFKLNLGIV